MSEAGPLWITTKPMTSAPITGGSRLNVSITKSFYNLTNYSVVYTDRNGVSIHAPSRDEADRIFNAYTTRRANGPSDVIYVKVEYRCGYNWMAMEHIRLTNKKKDGVATELDLILLEAITKTIREPNLEVNRNTVHTIELWYVYDVSSKVIGLGNGVVSIYLKEHDIVMDISHNAVKQNTLHPGDYLSNMNLDNHSLGDEFMKDAITVGLKLVNNEDHNTLNDVYYINIGGNVIPIKTVADPMLQSGMNMVIQGSTLHDKIDVANSTLEESFDKYPVYYSRNEAAARGNDREYFKLHMDKQKQQLEDVAQQRRLTNETNKRLTDTINETFKMNAEVNKILRLNIENEQNDKNREHSHRMGVMRDKSDILKNVVSLITSVIGFMTLITRVK